MKNENLIELKNIRKTYQLGKMTFDALKIDSLIIQRGEYAAILGPSGSGKSTLMNLLGCLDSPSEGQYFLNGKEVSQFKKNELAKVRNQEIGFIFQSFNLLEYATAEENVALPLVYAGLSLEKRRARAAHLLERVGLGNRLHHKPAELSGGQSQRVAIARALVNQPNLILADEPTGNLDSRSGEQVIQLFEECVDEGKTIIIVTHDLNLAKRAKRIIRILDGKMVAES
ncbi:MAG TPA: ABC transporter ATP-binding protein [Gammaproteobacteria bacterium]|jgi:putative ABC transport system ATP-binding protein|nr:ABC transporter ATP-binding protein [Gammaproteobacteria bacterium]